MSVSITVNFLFIFCWKNPFDFTNEQNPIKLKQHKNLLVFKQILRRSMVNFFFDNLDQTKPNEQNQIKLKQEFFSVNKKIYLKKCDYLKLQYFIDYDDSWAKINSVETSWNLSQPL